MNKILVPAILREGNRPFLSREGEVCKLIELSDDQIRFRTATDEATMPEAGKFSWLSRDERREILNGDVGLLEALYGAYGLTPEGDALEAVLAYEFDSDPFV